MVVPPPASGRGGDLGGAGVRAVSGAFGAGGGGSARPSELASEGSEDGAPREVAARPSEDRHHVPSEDVSSSEEDQSVAPSSSLGVEIDQTLGMGTACKKKTALRPCLSSQRQRRGP